MSEPHYIICMPWAEVKVPNSEKVVCSRCEQICGLSPATKIHAASHGAFAILCYSCFLKTMKGGEKFVPPSKGQIREIFGGSNEEKTQ